MLAFKNTNKAHTVKPVNTTKLAHYIVNELLLINRNQLQEHKRAAIEQKLLETTKPIPYHSWRFYTEFGNYLNKKYAALHSVFETQSTKVTKKQKLELGRYVELSQLIEQILEQKPETIKYIQLIRIHAKPSVLGLDFDRLSQSLEQLSLHFHANTAQNDIVSPNAYVPKFNCKEVESGSAHHAAPQKKQNSAYKKSF